MARVLFLATEDWFFVSHFLPVAIAARAAGFDVAVLTRVREEAHARTIEAAGVTLLRSGHERARFGPLAVIGQVGAFRRAIADARPDIVHCVSLRLIALGGLAAKLAGARRRVYAITGLGLLGASRTARARAARAAIGMALSGPLGGAGVRYVFENPDDPLLLGLASQREKTLIVGGAGVDPDSVSVAPPPPRPPLRTAIVARMVRSKGVPEAVEAIGLARAAGADVELTIHGAPDPANPRSHTEAELREWARRPGITWAGQTRDVAAVWRAAHVALVPSLGGEGLPRSLLEAAGAGRAIVTTDTPGCRFFVRNGIEGLVVPPRDAGAIAGALARLAADPPLAARMGAAARARLEDGFTTSAVGAAFVELYRDMLR